MLEQNPPLLYSFTGFTIAKEIRNSKNQFLDKVAHNCH